MKLTKIENEGVVCARLDGGVVITDAASALDVLMAAKYELGTSNLLIAKEHITEDFFILSTGLAGEILQKYVNYQGRVAIYGDFSRYTSKPLKDFMYESNKGKNVFFAATEQEALTLLTR